MCGERRTEHDARRSDGPDELLEAFLDQIPAGRVLDLGVGDGHNALWLARQGFDVLGVDASAQAVESVRRRADEQALSVDVKLADIRNLEIGAQSYALVLALAVLHFLRPDEIRDLAGRIKAGLKPGGVVIAHVFTVDDPSYDVRREANLTVVAENTFFVPELDGPLHYFDFGELRGLFDELEILHYAEERHLDLSRADADYHAGAFLVARK